MSAPLFSARDFCGLAAILLHLQLNWSAGRFAGISKYFTLKLIIIVHQVCSQPQRLLVLTWNIDRDFLSGTYALPLVFQIPGSRGAGGLLQIKERRSIDP